MNWRERSKTSLEHSKWKIDANETIVWWLSSKQHCRALAHSSGAGVVAGERGLSNDVQVAAKASVSLWRHRQQHDEMNIILVA